MVKNDEIITEENYYHLECLNENTLKHVKHLKGSEKNIKYNYEQL